MKLSLFAAVTFVTSSVALAQPVPSSPPVLCTDRPSKATSACTVPKGMLQIESDLVNWTRSDVDGVRTDTILYVSPLLKFGLTSSTDIEVSIPPYETIRTQDSSGANSVHGVGDLYLRVKQRLTRADATAQFAVEPFIKVPTAKSGIGNGKVEGGLIGTGVFSLPRGYTITVTPEIDELENANLDGHHAQMVGAFNVAKSLSPKLTASAELWTALDQDPSGHVWQYSADLSLAYLATPTVQLDAGTNFGLNRATPGVQAYAGVSTRF